MPATDALAHYTQAAQSARGRTREPRIDKGLCLYRGRTLRITQEPCCGQVEHFDCPRLGQEVWHTKCGVCSEHTTLDERREQAKAYEGRMVVILPARNEATPHDQGNKLLATVEALRKAKARGTDLRFAVFDDGSADGCATPLVDQPDVALLRNPEPHGQGVCRNLGVWLHRGARTYVSMDAHMDVDPFGLEQLALTAEETGGLVGCICRNQTNPDDPTRRTGYMWAVDGAGATLDIGQHRRRGKGAHFCYAKRDDPIIKPGVIPRGACFAFTEETHDALGGFGESYGFYGFADHDLALRCYFTGRPYLIDISVESFHAFRVNRPYASAARWCWWGYAECLRSMFRPDTWRRVFLPSAQWRADATGDGMLHYLIHAPRFDAIQADFETRKVRSDEEAIKWMGLA